jgi:hypothetical protein
MSLRKVHKLVDGAITNQATGEKDPIYWSGTGIGTLQIEGTFNGATVTLRGRIGGLAFRDLPGAVYSSGVLTTFDAGLSDVEAVISGSGGSSDLYVYISEPEIP